MMIKISFTTALVLLLLASSAAAAQQQSPCARGSSRIALGGIDFDLMKCKLAVDDQMIGSQAAAMASLQAQLLLLQNDLTAARAEIDKAQKDKAGLHDAAKSPKKP